MTFIIPERMFEAYLASRFMALLKENKTALTCYHCGEDCKEEVFYVAEKPFCCFGCKTVYEILHENDLCTYYDIQESPGKNQKHRAEAPKYDILDRPDIRSRFVTFEDERQYHVRFYLPHVHCSSCIWLLENLHALHAGIVQARVDFRRREIYLIAEKGLISLRDIAGLLDSIGYEPYLSLQDTEKKENKNIDRGRLIRIAVAGFCFGNIMMFSAPEYLARGVLGDPGLQQLFQYLSLLFSLPVFFYAADEFYISAWKSLRKRFLNIDAPIALAIIITFARSLYSVFVDGSGGYFDSMSGIVFFMLVGRYFQDKTYRMVSFNRDYKSYFPLSAAVVKDGVEVQVPISELKTGDVYTVRNNELIPADSILLLGRAQIDYSFVTGESDPLEKGIGELIYAGGRQKGSHLQLKVIKEVSQSYLTQLWNKSGESETVDEEGNSFVQVLSKYFAFIVLVLSLIAFIFWLFVDPTKALDALITPMIIACPCALLLSATFTNGNAIAWLGRAGLYLKNAHVLEKLTTINAVVFDKTGTIAQSKHAEVEYRGRAFTEKEMDAVFTLTNESSHPYSRAIALWCGKRNQLRVNHYKEVPGVGIEGDIDGMSIFIGRKDSTTGTHVYINNERLGVFYFHASIFEGIEGLMKRLQVRIPVYLLSGDSDKDKEMISAHIPVEHQTYHCKPEDKRRFIENLQLTGAKVMMVGDGLNDAGALMQSDVGVAVTADINSFTPASDVVIDARKIGHADDLIRYGVYAKKVIWGSFILSILYNIGGLYFALRGELEPVIAAILMPLSTISIVLFTTGLTTWYARRLIKSR